ncbi:MAG TPA: MBL fold metallo-hydrolase, partial [Thermomicrobiales bacterium]|nr:MBL fold metallo-hydrolase [Thermomicrobiales bacterium]
RNAIRSQFAERAAEARAEREAAEREAADATERATAARREESHAERCSDWLEKVAAEGTYAEPRPSRFSVRRATPSRPTLVDIANRGVVVPPPPEPARLLREGDVVAAGSLRFTVLDTPGHWRGDISLYAPAERAVFTGDALFRRAIGRFNPGCDIPTLLHSVRTRLLTLPDETVVYPAHGRATTIGDERRHNRSLRDYRDD